MNKILIVEDEAMLLDMMTSYLKSEKYDVIGTKSYNINFKSKAICE
ncbi:response regulator transcription factor [Campylobacter sp. faydin G-24]|uniref:Response regulator transcription factor n=1 Tax=Campylobacter anatolicus TaxID=2829105 RepID=A0ABS5HGI2_9BACT|nr:response regulator transcription factor [Campylobacter anatolicus]MBR8463115.1 response regulator transcription factor [Campylobacter anatolicus]